MLQKWNAITKPLISTLIVGLAICSGFLVGTVWEDLQPHKAAAPTIKSIQSVSIAINEANQMMIVDKKSGEYIIFTDSVGLTIFRMYAGKLYDAEKK